MKKLMTSVFFLFCAGALYASLPAPVAWWSMDAVEDGRVRDLSGSGRDLEIGPDCSLSDDAVLGKSLAFAGTAGSWSVFPCPGLRSRTVSFWFYREATDGSLAGNSLPYIVNGWSNLSMHMLFNDETVPAYVFLYGGQENAYMPNPPNFLRGWWTHYSFVLEDTGAVDGDGRALCNFRAYRDGRLYSFANNLATVRELSVANDAACLGSNAGGESSARPVCGRIDEVRLYDTALSDAQVAEEYARAGGETAAPGVLGHWKMAEVRTEDGKRMSPEANGGPGLVLGDGVTATNGLSGGGLSWDGTTASVASFEMPRAVSDFSVVTWMHLDPSHWSQIAPRLIEGGPGLIMVTAVDGDTVANLDFSLFGGEQIHVDHAMPAKQTWAHVAITARVCAGPDGTPSRLTVTSYVNGRQTGKVADIPVSYALAGGSTYCLGNTGSGVRGIAGQMDGFTFYGCELSERQVRELYRGAAAVDAGEDFTTSSESAVLCGFVHADAQLPLHGGYAGKVLWSVVSAPAGGEGVRVEEPESSRTTVELPVEGRYVFRLSTFVNGTSREDEVAVTRVSPSGALTPTVAVVAPETAKSRIIVPVSATVTGAERIRWEKVSGPGAVWFEDPSGETVNAIFSEAGEYVVRAVADGVDGSASATAAISVAADAVSLSEGLLGYWKFDGNGSNEVSAVEATRSTDFETWYEPGASGYGVYSCGERNRCMMLNVSPQETAGPDGKSTEQWRSFSCWIYHDPNYPMATKRSVIFYSSDRIGLWYENDTDHGFTLYENWGDRELHFPCPARDPVGRWVHVYAVFDRWETSWDIAGQLSEVWIDGVKLTPESGLLLGSAASQSGIYVGGMPYVAAYINTPMGYYTDDGTPEGKVLPRTFPGVIDEFRMYNRRLSEAEIKTLAQNPRVLNRAPQADVPEAVRAERRTPHSVTASYHDDGNPADGTVTYSWRVIEGDASRLVIEGGDAPTCRVTGKKSGRYKLQLAVSDGERTTFCEPVVVEIPATGMSVLVR